MPHHCSPEQSALEKPKLDLHATVVKVAGLVSKLLMGCSKARAPSLFKRSAPNSECYL